MHKKIWLLILLVSSGFSISAQETFTARDEEQRLKELRSLIQKKEYGFAYTLATELNNNPKLTQQDFFYQKDEIEMYGIVASLNMQQDISAELASKYLLNSPNAAGKSLVAFHLAHFYFNKGDYQNALQAYAKTNLEGLANEQIAQMKFEKAVAYFQLNDYLSAKSLFNETHQLPNSKYYGEANFYFGYLTYLDGDFNNAHQSFLIAEKSEKFSGIVPFYLTDILFKQNKKNEAFEYGKAALGKDIDEYYANQLRALMGHMYFEKGEFASAAKLLEDYVASEKNINKQIQYELSYSHYKTNQTNKAIEGFKKLSSEKDSLGQNSMFILGDLYLKTNDKANARSAFQFGAYNNSNAEQQRISLFNYAKLSYELGYQDVALREMRKYLDKYQRTAEDAEAKAILIDMLANTNNYEEAIRIYRSIDNPAPTTKTIFSKILYGRAAELMGDQQIDLASVLYDEILSVKSSAYYSSLSNFWKGEIAYRNKNYQDAIKWMKDFLQQNTFNGEANQENANYVLGYAQMNQQDFSSAKTNFNEIVSSVGNAKTTVQKDALLRLADMHYMLRDYLVADRIYAGVAQAKWPQADYATYQRAMIAGLKNSNDKINMLKSIKSQFPTTNLNEEVNLEIANAYLSNEGFLQAIPYLNDLVKTGGEDIQPIALQKLGDAYYNLDNNSSALATYKNLVARFPNTEASNDALAIIKNIYVEDGRAEDYLVFMQSIGKNVDGQEADSLTYASALQKWKENDCIVSGSSLQQYLLKYPSGKYATDANFKIAQCKKRNKDFSAAISSYDKVIAAGLGKYYETATLEAARIYYFELKKFDSSAFYFDALNATASTQENKLEAMRGLVRSYYNGKQISKAAGIANTLLNDKNINSDDRAIALLVLAKAQQLNGDCDAAIKNFEQVPTYNKAAWAAEARYELAHCYFSKNDLKRAEEKAMLSLKQSGSYDYWLTKTYILLGDIFLQQKDFFNAKATFESVAQNAAIAELKDEAKQKLAATLAEEKGSSNIK